MLTTYSVRLTAVAVLALLTGCANLSQIPDVDLAKPPPKPDPALAAASAPPPAITGSLFALGTYRPAFEDYRARMVGDTLTVQIVEAVTASQQSTSTVKRESDLSAGITAAPLLPTSLTSRFNTGANSANNFTGDGKTTSANTFTGNITATVTEVLSNGHLVVIGEKQIGVNQNVDVLQFSGTVDPKAIQPGNTISSTQIANVRVLSRGRGAQADAQTFGWLSRFFLTLLPF